jgi:hypothetical protein
MNYKLLAYGVDAVFHTGDFETFLHNPGVSCQGSLRSETEGKFFSKFLCL